MTSMLLVAASPPASAIVTWRVYRPALGNVAVVSLALFGPFTLNVTPAGPVGDQVYVRLGSPPSSAPSTLKAVAAPLTGLAATLATLATVGGWLGGAPTFMNHGVAVGSVVIR